MNSHSRRQASQGLSRIGSFRGATAIVVAAAMSIPISAAALSPSAPPTGSPGDLSAKAAAQIAALQKVKTSLSASERKLDSRLALSLRARADSALRQAVPGLDTLSATKDTSVAVDITVTQVTDGLLARLRGTGASIVHASATVRSVRAQVPPSALTTVAGWKDVRSVRAASGATTNDQAPGRSSTATEPKSARTARVEAALTKALNTAPARAAEGAVVSEGVKTHAVDKARARFKVSGVGTKVCALSDGVDSLAASQASGDLPDVDVLPGMEGSGDEGTAMLEIIHDVAPGAELGFATAFISDASFADNIRALRTQAECDIIVDDIIYYNESPFQDGPIAQAVNDVTADGALYFSSAGNEGNVIDGTSGNYEADFVDSGQGVGKFAGMAHDFDPGAGTQVYNPMSEPSAGVPVTLHWANPLGQANDDYDLYDFDAEGNVVNFAQDVQDGDDDPFEIMGTSPFATGQRLAVVKFSGQARYFQLTAFRGRFSDSQDGLTGYATDGVTRGHSAAVNAFSTAAAPADEPLPFDLEDGDPPNPSGPYPDVFTRSQQPERFTSDGPRRMFFKADGTPYTPGNTTSTGGVVRQKPDITAADGVSTTAPGFETFYGTSAAAPHAAAIAALVLSGNPGIAPRTVRSAMTSTAIDLAPAGVDSRTGHGIVMANRILNRTGATPQPLVRVDQGTVAPAGDGDAYLEPGETGILTVPATNVGDSRATSVSVRLSENEPGVTITPASRGYGSIAPQATVNRTFTVTLAEDYPLGKPLTINAKATFVGVLSPTTSTMTIATGEPGGPVRSFSYAGPPVPIPDRDVAGASVTLPVDGMQYASNVTFSIDGTTCTADIGATTVGLDHTYVGDLTGTLTSPSGATATLFNRNGSSGNNFCQVVFDDAAAQSIVSVGSADAPFTGTYQPISPLSALLDATVGGDWTFTTVDNAGGDTGSIRAVTLNLTGFVE